jgi:predicted Ser/Thr protein kinase
MALIGKIKNVPNIYLNNGSRWTAIDSGAYGIVYMSGNGKEVLKKSLGNSLEPEFKLLTRLKKFNFVPEVYDISKNKKIIIMSKVPGVPLHKIYHNLTPSGLLEVRTQLLQYIKEFEKMGIVHGDLHSGNIFIDVLNNDTIKVYVIDFGLSNARQHREYVHTVKNVSGTYKIKYGPQYTNRQFINALFPVPNRPPPNRPPNRPPPNRPKHPNMSPNRPPPVKSPKRPILIPHNEGINESKQAQKNLKRLMNSLDPKKISGNTNALNTEKEVFKKFINRFKKMNTTTRNTYKSWINRLLGITSYRYTRPEFLKLHEKEYFKN